MLDQHQNLGPLDEAYRADVACLVARSFVGSELNPEYAAIATVRKTTRVRRDESQRQLFTEVSS